MAPRTDALINGALMAIGILGVVDNVLVHWGLGLHRAIPGEHALSVEILLVVFSLFLFAVGFRRERRARRHVARGASKAPASRLTCGSLDSISS